MRLYWFKSEEGSTSLAIVVAIVLALALLAGCLQWYWTNSSSSDIQTLADVGALAAADAGAKTTMLIQALDALLLTANLFGLLLHCVVVVAGVVTVVSTPVGGAGAAAFFEKAVQFDKDYCERRRKFAHDVQRFAQALAEATPYLAMAQSYRMVAENRVQLENFNEAQYVAMTIPFPFKGEVELTGYAANEEHLLDEATEANKANSTSAKEIKHLEEEVERGLDECYRLDIYKPSSTQRAHWDPASSLTDFKRGFKELAASVPDAPLMPVPIENTAANRAKLAERFVQEYRRLGQAWDSSIRAHIGTVPAGSDAIPARDMDAETWLAPARQARVLLLQHIAGKRRAYHSDAHCFGLAGSKATLRSVTLGEVLGDDDHPPCVLCAPPHWRALAVWQQNLREYVRAWNKEAAALRAYQKAKRALVEEQETLHKQTSDALKSIVEDAGGFLTGGRLKYTPSGARGFLCVVATTHERSLPNFTLPALTGSKNVRLGRQVALAGARLMPSTRESTLPSLLEEAKTETADNSGGVSNGLGGIMGALLGSKETGAPFVLKLWGTCLSLYTKGSKGLETSLQGLPWGLDALITNSLKKLSAAAQLTAPDLRRPQPTLVNTADIGDPTAGGLEGAVSTTLRRAKTVYEQAQGANTTGLKAGIESSLEEMNATFSAQVEKVTSIKILGVTLPLPFAESIKALCAKAIEVVRGKERELLAALGEGTL